MKLNEIKELTKTTTNDQWNALNWETTGIELSTKPHWFNSCYDVANLLGYARTGEKDYWYHEIYEKDGKYYYIENRNTGVEIAEINYRKKINYFTTREECIEFLKEFDFKWFVPYLENHTRYYVELTKDLKSVRFCQTESIASGLIYSKSEFYDIDEEYILDEHKCILVPRYNTMEEGEAAYEETIRLLQYFKNEVEG